MSKDTTMKELGASIRRCEDTIAMLKQLPLFHEKRKELLPQTEMDLKLLLEVRAKLSKK